MGTGVGERSNEGVGERGCVECEAGAQVQEVWGGVLLLEQWMGEVPARVLPDGDTSGDGVVDGKGGGVGEQDAGDL